ncbi:MAG: SdiA-regulated domain-containing protein, partial [Prolixibacteraceae bacterium]
MGFWPAFSSVKPQPHHRGCGFNLTIYFLFLLGWIQLCTSCSKTADDGTVGLIPIEVIKLGIPEPSDLAFGPGNQILFTVSDNTAKVYKITTQGKILQTLPYVGNDLEGVCYVNDQFLYVAEERLRKIVKLDLQGNQLSEAFIPVEINDANSGLEGISYNPVNKYFYILNEVNPGLLIVTDENFNVIKKQTLSFAGDYSGICVDAQKQELWILSDVSATANRCTLDGQLIEKFKVPVNNPEGIALDSESHLLYIVSDQEGTL